MFLKARRRHTNSFNVDPLVSIITPTYNSQMFLEQTIDSIVNQTYKNWELIIVDDASSDNTVNIINNYVSEFKNIHLIQNEINLGAGVARNKGIQAAKGDFIAFLDSDDLWNPNKLKVQIKYMIKNHLDVCFSSYDLVSL